MNATIYIREENEDEWRMLPNKSEWINEMLVGRTFKQVMVDGVVSSSDVFPTKDNFHQLRKVNQSEQCPHGFAKGFCKKAECNKKFRSK